MVGASEADPNLGFMGRTMALCSLPRSNPGNRKKYKRVNGPFTLYMVAGGGNKLPFGNLPRLILAWVSTEAVRTQSRELVLGRSLAEFMRTLGIYHNSGGRGGVQTRLRNQMDRRTDNKTQPKTRIKPPDSLHRAASQAAGAAPTLRYGPAGDSAPQLRLGVLYGRKVPFGFAPNMNDNILYHALAD